MKCFSKTICFFAMAVLTTACGKTEFSSAGDGASLKADGGDANGELLVDGVENPALLSEHSCGREKVYICHVPPGDPNNPQTLCISENAIAAHLAHQASPEEADMLGTCDNEPNKKRCQSRQSH